MNMSKITIKCIRPMAHTPQFEGKSHCNQCELESMLMKCKVCKGTGVVAQRGLDGDWEPSPCDCTIDPNHLEE